LQWVGSSAFAATSSFQAGSNATRGFTEARGKVLGGGFLLSLLLYL
jgi:hypothetical protein